MNNGPAGECVLGHSVGHPIGSLLFVARNNHTLIDLLQQAFHRDHDHDKVAWISPNVQRVVEGVMHQGERLPAYTVAAYLGFPCVTTVKGTGARQRHHAGQPRSHADAPARDGPAPGFSGDSLSHTKTSGDRERHHQPVTMAGPGGCGPHKKNTPPGASPAFVHDALTADDARPVTIATVRRRGL